MILPSPFPSSNTVPEMDKVFVNPKSTLKLSFVPILTVVPFPLCVLSFSELSLGTLLSLDPDAGSVPVGVATVTV